MLWTPPRERKFGRSRCLNLIRMDLESVRAPLRWWMGIGCIFSPPRGSFTAEMPVMGKCSGGQISLRTLGRFTLARKAMQREPAAMEPRRRR